jgi:hypothetical protein
MATLLAPTRINSGTSQLTQMHFYRYSVNDVGSNNFIHLKTNIARYCGAMYMIEAVGRNYNLAQPIRCAWTGYMYDLVPTTIYNPTQFQAYTGLTAHGQYLSSDNFLVLRATATTILYTAFTLSIYQLNPVVNIPNVAITAVATNTTSGAHF